MTDKEKRELKDGVISIFKRFNILDHTATIGSLRDDILRYINSLKEEPVSDIEANQSRWGKSIGFINESTSDEIGDYDHKAVMESLCPQLKEEPTIPDIVDEHYDEMLGEEPVSIWHDANEEQPEEYRTVVAWNPTTMNGEILTRCVEVYKGRIWAYIEDLLKLSNVEQTFKLNK